MASYGRARQAPEAISGPQQWLVFHNFTRALGRPEEKFTADKYPIVAFNQQGIINLYVSDPEIAKDVLVSKNALTDKQIDSYLIFEMIIGQSFIFSRNDEVWKAKRKAIAHAFYKDRLEHMLETLKKTAAETFVRWADQIDKNGGSFEINMATEFSDILARNIVHICFGEDISEEMISLQVMRDGKWVTEDFTLKDSTYQIVTQVIQNFYKQV